LKKLFQPRNVRATVWCLSFLLAVAMLLPQVSAKDPDKFKPFKLKTLDGTKKTLQDYANKATLVSFFFPNCPFCNVALPEEQKLYEKYKDRGLSVVWINVLPEENKLIRGWMEKNNLTIPVLIGASQAVLQRNYQLIATPTNYLLGEKGEVLFYHSGYKAGDEKILEAKIVEALNITPQ
jgi:thiol-disulfide isomerase/thioredoxin